MSLEDGATFLRADPDPTARPTRLPPDPGVLLKEPGVLLKGPRGPFKRTPGSI